MGDQQRGVDLALLNQRQCLGTLAAAHTTGLEGQILTVHLMAHCDTQGGTGNTAVLDLKIAGADACQRHPLCFPLQIHLRIGNPSACQSPAAMNGLIPPCGL